MFIGKYIPKTGAEDELSHKTMGLSEPTACDESTAVTEAIDALAGHYFCGQGDWPIVPFTKSVVATNPLFQHHENDGSILVEFSPPVEHTNDAVIIFSDEHPPTLSLFLSSPDENGLNFRSFNLTDSDEICESHLHLAVKALEANFNFISASTKFSEEEKTKYLSFVRDDIDYIWNFIKHAITDRCGYAYMKEKIEMIDQELRNNSPYFWRLLKNHKVTDFNFKAIKESVKL
jgi:hypothetical protein